MKLENFTTELINWETIKQTETGGETGINTAGEFTAGNTRIRIAEYSANYKSAEWCDKGHIIHCIAGEITLFFSNGNEIMLGEGKSVVIADGDSHIAETGSKPARLFIAD